MWCLVSTFFWPSDFHELTRGCRRRLYPLSEKENMCKALLPIGNEPMISYSLAWLEQAGIIGQSATDELTALLPESPSLSSSSIRPVVFWWPCRRSHSHPSLVLLRPVAPPPIISAVADPERRRCHEDQLAGRQGSSGWSR